MKKIICLLMGHDYIPITIHNLEKRKKEHIYQCSRCGYRSKFNNMHDTIVHNLLVNKIKNIWNQKSVLRGNNPVSS